MAYNTQEERLKVRGSESITRDLQVTGDVYVGGELTVDNSTVLTEADKGVSNGVATLDATGRVPYSQLPESAMEYKGTWDASTNTPTLTDGTGTNGDFYIVSVAGTVDFGAGRSITFYVNDRVIYDGATSQWARLPAGEVRSVNGQTGDVTLSIPAAQVNSDWNATSGVAQILNKPTIPTVVDTVADGNMNAVTSNAVYDYIDAADIASKLDKVTIMPANPTDKQSVLYLGETTENYVKGHLYQYINGGYTSNWSPKTWSGFILPSPSYVWTDGTHTYYSDNETQYVLDSETSTWLPKAWSGLTSFLGSGVWTDGANIYLSQSSKQYVLDIETSTWSPKTWTGLTTFSGNNVWTDGTHIYFSLGTKQYVLDPATSTWSPKTWSGLTNISCIAIWSDGTNVYYSNNANQYVLDPSTSTWSPKTWSGLTNFAASRIWTDGSHFYYSSDASQYILDPVTSTWTEKSWTGLTSFLGNNVWTDGTSVYMSNDASQYVLDTAQSWVDITPTNFTTALSDAQLLKWDADNTKAVGVALPVQNNTVLTAQIDSTTGEVGYTWKSSGSSSSIIDANLRFEYKDITDRFDAGIVSDDIANGDFSKYSLGNYIKKEITIPAYQNGNISVPATTVTVRIVFAHFNLFCADELPDVGKPYTEDANANTLTPHVACIICDLPNCAMNSSKTTSGGYFGSYMHQTFLTGCVLTALSGVGITITDHLVKHSKILTTSINETGYNRYGSNTGCSNAWDWKVDQYISLMSEVQLYGSTIWSSSGYDTGEANEKLAIFNLIRPNKLFGNRIIWLRDVASATYFATLNNSGNAYVNRASPTSIAPAPLILLK